MTSFTKPEIHTLRATATHVTCVENLVKFGYMVSETCGQTDRQTDLLIRIPLLADRVTRQS